MRKLMKTCLAAVLAFSMLLSLGTIAFAATGNVRTSSVVFTGSASELSAEAFVRNGGEATLIVAVYDGNTLSEAVSATGANQILSAGPVNAEGKKLKAFVWDQANLKVISEIATYDGTDVYANLNITIDGVDFADYVDEETVDFSESSDYTKTFAIGEAELPVNIDVKGDNGLTATVVTDTEAENPKTTITVGYGISEQKTTTDEEIYYWYNNGIVEQKTFLYENKIENEKVYTITYKEAKDSGVVYTSDITASGSPVTQAGQYKWLYKKTFTGGTEAVPQLVEVDLNNQQGKGAVIVVQPKDGKATDKAFDDIIVASDGTKFTASDDKYNNVISGGKREVKADGTIGIADGTIPQQKGKGSITVVVKGTENTTDYVVVSNFHSYNGLWCGSRPGITQNPRIGNQMCIEDRAIVGDDSTEFTGEYAVLNGGQYIPLAWSADSVGKVSFYVNQDVDVYVLDATKTNTDRIATLSDEAGWNFKEIENPTVYETYMNSCVVKISYTDEAGATSVKSVNTPMTIAYAKHTGAITEEEAKFAFYEKQPIVSGTNGTYEDPNDTNVNLWRVYGHDLGRKISDLQFSNSNGFFDTSVLDNKIVYNSLTDDAELADYENVFSDLESGFSGGNIISDFKQVVGETTDYSLRIFDVTPGVTDDGNKNTPGSYGKFAVYSDRSNGVGVLKQYSPALEIKGEECVVFSHNFDNGVNTDWNSGESKEYFNFKVTQDAEVMIFANQNCYYADIASAHGETGWNEVTLDAKDLQAYIDRDDTFNALSIKEFNANDEVKIYSPGKHGKYIVVVKPIAE